MGAGKGPKIDLPLIMRAVCLLCCAVGVGLNVAENTESSGPRIDLVSNSLIYSTGAYLIILGFFLFWTIFQSEVDKKFAAIILICGFLWTAGAGIGVLIFNSDYEIHTLQLVGGIMALVAGVVMLVDGIHNLGCF